jgi:uncharacterized membrane protein YbhN (UPF0104 family)
MSSAEALHPKERRSRRFAWIGMAASILLFGASLVVLWHIVSEIDVNELKSAFTAASLRQIGLAVLLTALSYSLLTCYDAIALRQLKLQIPYRTTALASFTSYAVSFTLGFPLLTAGTVRYWIYAPKGVSPGRVASLTVIAGVTFWLGMALVLAWSLISKADELASLVYTHIWMNQLVGLGAVAFVIAYMVWVSLKRRSVKIQGWKLELPGFRLSLAQILIGAGDVCAGAGVQRHSRLGVVGSVRGYPARAASVHRVAAGGGRLLWRSFVTRRCSPNGSRSTHACRTTLSCCRGCRSFRTRLPRCCIRWYRCSSHVCWVHRSRLSGLSRGLRRRRRRR